MKLLRPLAGYTLYDHKTNDYIRREIRITGILKKKLNSVALVRERTIPTERPPPVGEVSANFCG